MFNPINAFSKLGIDFSIKLISEKDLESILDLSEEKRTWLKRYQEGKKNIMFSQQFLQE